VRRFAVHEFAHYVVAINLLFGSPAACLVSRKNAEAKVKAKKAVKVVDAIGLYPNVSYVIECANFDLQTKSPDPRVTSPPWNKFNRDALETRFTSDASSPTEQNHAAAPRLNFAWRAPPR
jgi:hypothetical protein